VAPQHYVRFGHSDFGTSCWLDSRTPGLGSIWSAGLSELARIGVRDGVRFGLLDYGPVGPGDGRIVGPPEGVATLIAGEMGLPLDL
jgi:hypothetical protein